MFSILQTNPYYSLTAVIYKAIQEEQYCKFTEFFFFQLKLNKINPVISKTIF